MHGSSSYDSVVKSNDIKQARGWGEKSRIFTEKGHLIRDKVAWNYCDFGAVNKTPL